MTSLSNPNQNLKIEPQHLEPADQKNNLSLEPDRQRTSQECGRFQEQTSQRTSQDRPLETSQAYSFEKVKNQTREQHKSDRWYKERNYKLTSSRFGEICKRRKYDLKYCESLSTNQKDLSHIPAVKFGLNQEKVALEQFKQRILFDVVKKDQKKRALDLGKQALEVGKKKAKLVGKQALDLGKQKVKEFGQKTN